MRGGCEAGVYTVVGVCDKAAMGLYSRLEMLVDMYVSSLLGLCPQLAPDRSEKTLTPVPISCCIRIRSACGTAPEVQMMFR